MIVKCLFPYFESSDKELDITYRYRCELYEKHIKEIPMGHVISNGKIISKDTETYQSIGFLPDGSAFIAP